MSRYHIGYAAMRISSKLNGRTSKFGWLQAPATNFYRRYNGLGASTAEPFFFSVQLASKTPHTASPSWRGDSLSVVADRVRVNRFRNRRTGGVTELLLTQILGNTETAHQRRIAMSQDVEAITAWRFHVRAPNFPRQALWCTCSIRALDPNRAP
jgi:hypothetical protein